MKTNMLKHLFCQLHPTDQPDSVHCLKTFTLEEVAEPSDICTNTNCIGRNLSRLSKKHFNYEKTKLCDLWLPLIFNSGNVKQRSAVALLLIPYSLHNSRLSFDSVSRHCMGTETNLIETVRARNSLPNLTQQQAIFIFLHHYLNYTR